MHFVVARPLTSALDLVCKDKGRLSDTVLGAASVPVSSLERGRLYDELVPL
jgi:hypothetical protein